MGRLVDVDDLATVKMLGEAHGVTAAAICNWYNRYAEFPRPVAVVSGTRLYLRSEVAQWVASYDSSE